MPKRHCQKHTSYYYRCPDCRRLNDEDERFSPADSGSRLYPDAFGEGNAVRIPVEGPEPPEEPATERPLPGFARSPAPRAPPRRYHGGYSNKGTPNRKKLIIAGVVLASIVAFLIVIWAIPAWYANIDLQMQLYASKAGGFTYWNLYTLNWWSTNFFFNKTALIGGIIGAILMVLPFPDRAILSLIAEWRGRPTPTRAKAFAFWLPVGFGLFYLFGQLMNVVGQFSWGAFLVEKGQISGDFANVINALKILFDPTSANMSTIFSYEYYWLPIISFIFGVVIFRLILAIVEYAYLKQDLRTAAANGFLLVGMIFGISLFNLPLQPVDGLAQIQNWAVVLGFFAFLGMGIFIFVYAKSARQVAAPSWGSTKKMAVAAGIAVIILVVPLFISIPTAIGINQDTNTWTQQKWNKDISTEIDWTQWTAGIKNIDRRPISELITGNLNQTEDQDLLSVTRLFNQTYAYLKMLPQTKTEEALADAQIIYYNGVEYWITPKTVDWTGIANGLTGGLGSIQENTNLYDHVEGFYAMDTHSNELLTPAQTQAIFNVSANYPIFFGDHQSQTKSEGSSSANQLTDLLGGSGGEVAYAYDQNILLSTNWSQNAIQGYQYQWNSSIGTPDGSLTGLEKFWFDANLGLFSYAISQANSSYLINRYIMNRVGAIMYPGLQLDPNPYFVFDQAAGRVYYAVSIYLDMPLKSYAQSDILRFIGVCLVDVESGTLQFIRNPQYADGAPSASVDPTAPFWSFYLTNQAYNWTAMPTWLLPQLRYPQTLYDDQLGNGASYPGDYRYHVNNPADWLRGDQWYTQPESANEVFYIETSLAVNQPVEFVGLRIANRINSYTLAGIYAVRHGSNFGQIVFYGTQALNATEIGPDTALSQLENVASQDLTLIGAGNWNPSNILLYPLGGSIYYLIPIYRTSTSGSSALLQLLLVGLVNATDRTTSFGYNTPDLLETAYKNLNLTYMASSMLSNVSLTYALSPQSTWNGTTNTTDADFARVQFNVQYPDLGNVNDSVSVTLNLTAHSNILIVNETGSPITGVPFTSGTETWCNYTLVNPYTLYPGQGLTGLAKLNADITSLGAQLTIYYELTLTVVTHYGTQTVTDGIIHTLTVSNANGS